MRTFSLVLGTAWLAAWVGAAHAEDAPAPAATDAAAVATAEPASADADAGDETDAAPAMAGGSAMAETADAETPSAAMEADASEPAQSAAAEDASMAEDAPAPEVRAHAPVRTASVSARAARIELGPVGYDADGIRGRLHTVARGDTLWDISEAYLGTPWVWPSVWHENEGIANPHVIRPGDLIWITSSEMRRVTRTEADALLAGSPKAETAMAEADAAPAPEPAAPAPDAGPSVGEPVVVDLPASLDGGEGGGVPGSAAARARSTIRIADRESMSFVSSETLEAATSIVDNTFGRTWIAAGDVVHVGAGEGVVEVGDQFTIFRDAEPVRGLDGDLLGYHVQVLGWLEISEVHPETSLANVRMSGAEMHVGDRLVPREVPDLEVTVRPAPVGFEGHVVHLPDFRTVAGTGDYVFLDRGGVHGLEVGSAIEVLEEGHVEREVVSHGSVRTSDIAVAELVVVTVKPEVSVAIVNWTHTEIERGAPLRASFRRIASAR